MAVSDFSVIMMEVLKKCDKGHFRETSLSVKKFIPSQSEYHVQKMIPSGMISNNLLEFKKTELSRSEDVYQVFQRFFQPGSMVKRSKHFDDYLFFWKSYKTTIGLLFLIYFADI